MGPKESRMNHGTDHPPVKHESPASRSPDALERDVRARRHHIDALLDELSNVVHPKHLVRQAVDWMRSSDNRDDVKHKAAQTGASLKASSREMGRKISDKITSITHDAKEASREVFEKRRTQTASSLHHLSQDAAREANQVKEQAKDKARENPMMVALGFLGAGVIAGMMMPDTRTERKVIRKAADTFSKGAFQDAGGGTTMVGDERVASA